MASRILDLPLALFGVLFIGGFVALSIGLAVAVRPLVQKRFGEEHKGLLHEQVTVSVTRPDRPVWS